MEINSYKNIIEKAPFGYACHKIILDKEGKPCDYEFLEINDSFEKLTGLKKENILNKKYSEVFHDGSKNEFNWVKFYGKIALECGNEEFEQYSDNLKSWYKVQVYSNKKEYFYTVFTNITKEKENIEKLDDFFNIDLDLLSITDIRGNFIKVNKEWENVLGYNIDELSEIKLIELVHPEDVKETFDSIKNLIKQNQIINFVNRCRTKDGTYRYIEWRACPKGKLIYTAARDITDKKEKEKLLIASEAKYRIILEASREIALVLQDNKIVFFNHMLEKVTSYTGDELLGMEIERLIYKDELNLALNSYYKKNSGEHVLPYQFKLTGKDNTIIWLELGATEIDWQGENAVLCFLTDVTQRREYEVALYESEKRKASLIKSMDDMIFVLDSNFVFKEFYAPDVEKLYFKPEDFFGKKIDEINFPKPAFDIIKDELEKVRITGNLGQAEYYIESSLGIRWYDIRITFVSGTKYKDVEFLCVIRDITKLKESEEEIRLERDLFSAGPVMTMIWEPSENWPIKRVSKNVETLLGYKEEELLKEDFRYTSIIHPEDIKRVFLEVDEYLKNDRETFEQSYRIKNKAGKYCWYYDFTRIIKSSEWKIIEIRGYLFDQSQIKDAESRLKMERERLNNIIEGTNAGTWEWNVQTNETKYDEKWAEMLGYTLEEIRNSSSITWENLAHPEDLEKGVGYTQKHFSGEIDHVEYECRVKHKNGQWVWMLTKGKILSWTDDGKPLLMFGINMDISERKTAEEKIIELSIRDPLTNVYNRRYIFERLGELKIKYKRIKEEFSIAILDIDYFKLINDNYGHVAGDYVLQEFTKSIQNNIRPFDLLGRYGGEEFIIVMVNCKKEIAYKRLEKILEKTRNSIFNFNDSAITLTFSAGIADSNDFDFNSISLDILIDTADKRLYKAKELGRNRVVIFNETGKSEKNYCELNLTKKAGF